jgi:hypothetical protein
MPHLFHYYLGLDLGQARDYTAISLIEEPVWIDPEWAWEVSVSTEEAGWRSPAELTPTSPEGKLPLVPSGSATSSRPLHKTSGALRARYPLPGRYREGTPTYMHSSLAGKDNSGPCRQDRGGSSGHRLVRSLRS